MRIVFLAGAYGFKHEVNNLIQTVVIDMGVLQKIIVLNIVLYDFPVYLNRALGGRFLSVPFLVRQGI